MSHARQRADLAHETLHRRIREALRPLVEKDGGDADDHWRKRGDYVVSRLATASGAGEIRAILCAAFGVDNGAAVTKIQLALRKHRKVMEDIGEIPREGGGAVAEDVEDLGVVGPLGAFFIGSMAAPGFVVIFGAFVAAVGGTFNITLPAVFALFLAGGCLGLAYRACYVRGWWRGRSEPQDRAREGESGASDSSGAVAE